MGLICKMESAGRLAVSIRLLCFRRVGSIVEIAFFRVRPAPRASPIIAKLVRVKTTNSLLLVNVRLSVQQEQ